MASLADTRDAARAALVSYPPTSTPPHGRIFALCASDCARPRSSTVYGPRGVCLPFLRLLRVSPETFADVWLWACGYAQVVVVVVCTPHNRRRCNLCKFSVARVHTLACTATYVAGRAPGRIGIEAAVAAFHIPLCDVLVSCHSPPNERATRQAAAPALTQPQALSNMPGCWLHAQLIGDGSKCKLLHATGVVAIDLYDADAPNG